MKTSMRKIFSLLIAIVLMRNAAFAQQPEIPVSENEEKTHYLFSIIGYNYTNRHIDGFSIDGQGGGDVRVSSPTSGGGGIVCCVLFSKKPKWPIHVLIRWQSGGCRVWHKDRRFGHNRYYYKETTVNVEPGSSKQPSGITVHFFQDGSVRVRLINDLEPPLVRLPEERAVDDYFPECKATDPVEYL